MSKALPRQRPRLSAGARAARERLLKQTVRTRSATPRPDAEQAALRVQQLRFRAALRSQREIAQLGRQLKDATARARTSVASLIGDYAAANGLRVMQRDYAHDLEANHNRLTIDLQRAHERIEELERDVTNTAGMIERAADIVNATIERDILQRDAPARELSYEPDPDGQAVPEPVSGT